MKTILTLLFLVKSIFIFSQAPIHFENKTQIYLIGDVDLDRYFSCDEFTYLIDNSILAQKNILTHLSDSLNLKYIMKDAPISFEYSYNKFLETNKLDFSVPYYKHQKLKLYNEIQDRNELVRIKCFGTNAHIEPNYLIYVLFEITIGEPYKDSISPIQSYDPSIYNPYYLKAYKEKLLNSNLHEIEFILDLYYSNRFDTGKRKLNKLLYEGFLNISDTDLILLKAHLGNNYDYFCRMKESFISEYGISKFNKKKQADLRYENFLHAINLESEDTYYVASEITEVQSKPKEKNLISRLEEGKIPVNSVYLYNNQYFEGYELDWVKDYNADFFGMEKYYIHKISENKYLYCVTVR